MISLSWQELKKIKDITIDVAAEAIRARKNEALQITVILLKRFKQKLENFTMSVSMK